MNFIETPNEENAEKLLTAFSAQEVSYEELNSPEGREVRELMYQKILAVEKALKSGSVKSFDVAFRLFAFSDGGFSEELDIILGGKIITHPEVFLTSLKNNRKYVLRLDALLGNLGDEYIDEFQKELDELRRRYDVIEAVENESLSAIKKECLDELHMQIGEN